MPRLKRKRAVVESDSDSNEDSDNGSSSKTAAENIGAPVKKRKTKNTVNDDTASSSSVANVTVINAGDRKVDKKKPSKRGKQSISSMKEKEQQLDESRKELINAIINKTQVLSDNELSKKTSEVLTGCCSGVGRMDDEHQIRSPIHRALERCYSIGKNDQIVMAGYGEKQNPVWINSMSKNLALEENDENRASQNSDKNGSDYSQSIASTPKKSNIEVSVDKSTGKTSQQLIKIPVARLFADNDPNNSMSEMNPVPTSEILRSSASKENKTSGCNNNVSRIPTDLNNTVSPILSQGTRQNRISRLSLKRKTLSNNTSRASNNTVNESFINRPPLTCSSFVDKPEKASNKSHLDQHTKTVILEGKSDSSDNQKTIILDDNENNTNTINIDHSSSRSSMEITTISARTPIIRKSFQQVIQESFRFDKADIPNNKTLQTSIPNQQSTNENKSSIEKARKSNSSNTTVRTPLNANTSLDDVSLSERIENGRFKRPSNTKQSSDQTSKNNSARDSQSLTKMRSSLRVNTSLDSVRRSSDNSKTDSDVERRENTELRPTSSSDNQEKEGSTGTTSHRSSNATVRSSMNVNTSLDSVQKSPNRKKPLNYNKILSMVEEASNLQSESSDESEMENESLSKRIQNNRASKSQPISNKQDSSKERRSEAGKDNKRSSMKRKSKEPGSSDTQTEKPQAAEKNELETKRKSSDNAIVDFYSNLQKSNSKDFESETSKSTRKSTRKSSSNSSKRTSLDVVNVSSNESSVVEATPFPASRSLLFKTMIKNNIAMNTVNSKKLMGSSDDDENDEVHLPLTRKKNSSNKHNSGREKKDTQSDDSSDTVIVDTSDESSNESKRKKNKIVIDESVNDTGIQNKSKTKRSRKLRKQKESGNSDSSDEEENRKVVNKRKLYPLRENSQISFSAAEMSQAPQEPAPKDVKKKKKRKMTQKKQEKKPVSPEPVEESDHAENEISIPKPEKKKKPRKIKSKKIVVKKVTNMTLLDDMLENDKELVPTKDRSSLREFDLRSTRANTTKQTKDHKIVIVVTGHDKDDKDLVKNVIKTLGSATMQATVTPRTTHVISSGTRTINLFRGIIRGCWLVTLEWALKSLESEKWLDPAPYEMSHYAKAVQINRRDRYLFGKAYVPELFITSGPIHIQNGTTPPASILKELVKTAGGRIIEDINAAKVIVGTRGLKENWILDSITTGELQSVNEYKRS